MIADSTGETAARVARVVQTQFPGRDVPALRHPRITRPAGPVRDLRVAAGARPDAGSSSTRSSTSSCANSSGWRARRLGCPTPTCSAMRSRAFEQATGREADEVMRRPVGVEADYFVRISAMEFAIRNDDGAMPEALRECDICLVGASRSGKTPLSIYLGYLGYKVVNVPLVPGIEPPRELFGHRPVADRRAHHRRRAAAGDPQPQGARSRRFRHQGRLRQPRLDLRRTGRGGPDPAQARLSDHRHHGSRARGGGGAGHRRGRPAGAAGGWPPACTLRATSASPHEVGPVRIAAFRLPTSGVAMPTWSELGDPASRSALGS